MKTRATRAAQRRARQRRDPIEQDLQELFNESNSERNPETTEELADGVAGLFQLLVARDQAERERQIRMVEAQYYHLQSIVMAYFFATSYT